MREEAEGKYEEEGEGEEVGERAVPIASGRELCDGAPFNCFLLLRPLLALGEHRQAPVARARDLLRPVSPNRGAACE